MFYLFLFIRFNELCAALFVLQKMLKETIMHFKANLANIVSLDVKFILRFQ